MRTLVLAYHADAIPLEKLVPAFGPGILDAKTAYPAMVRAWAKSGELARRFLACDLVVLYTGAVNFAPDPLLALLAARWMGRRVVLADGRGLVRPLGVADLMRFGARYVRDALALQTWLAGLDVRLHRLEALARNRKPPPVRLADQPAYLRTDLIADLRAGGSVGHVAGVCNNLGRFGGAPVLFTTDRLPTVRGDIETHCILPTHRKLWSQRGLPALTFSEDFAAQCWRLLADRPVSFLYQRHALNNWSGTQLALEQNLPFVLEYNGSEVWVARNWGTGLPHAALAERIETVALRTADLVVVVSEPLRDELVARGVLAHKILVNPNGVDCGVYHPGVDGEPVRRRHGLEGRLVFGFIGTFGAWHGAEKLAEAFALLLDRRPDLRSSARLLFIGDGVRRAACEEILTAAGVRDLAVFTGTVPQVEGPAHLAACDILVAPHVPNADGSRFFGSPTKLFEYMAMGKAIAASALDQMDEVLEQGETALKTVPGDAQDLARALELLADDPELRRKLGEGARKAALERHSWSGHTRRIMDALVELSQPPGASDREEARAARKPAL
ncbi:MAG TPA: glycosyltransferase family 4 protein [Humidesulfovibrio sp.]|uniref:glycosyltransferase family 4 protein n=1 Tax=Humidesulfovibrio sp. TaxID=2910988 RepID=UPI002B89AB4B|nr:glycosyltransferase family 4 protein [Humidesulfovibrio sp.]HWR02672.1 glycosyltransferase family 4 protein [Humidesulfovibrio sp.]